MYSKLFKGCCPLSKYGLTADNATDLKESNR